MKTEKLLIVTIVFILFPMFINAQNLPTTGVKNQRNSMVSTSNSIELMGSSDIREIEIEVAEEGASLSIDISGEIQKGSMKIEIYDPKGKKRGSFATGEITENKSSNAAKNQKANTYEERVNGRIMQQNALSGVWIVKIIPKEAHGKFMCRNQQTSQTNY